MYLLPANRYIRPAGIGRTSTFLIQTTDISYSRATTPREKLNYILIDTVIIPQKQNLYTSLTL
jgi:hypothetical protein